MSKTTPSKVRRLALAAALIASPASAASTTSVPELASQVDQAASQVKAAADSLWVVETRYADPAQLSEEDKLLKRYSDAEVQYLLGNFSGASVMYYDLVQDPAFQRHPRYQDALFFLSDALYQQKNDIGARTYLRALMKLRGPRYGEALARYLEIASRQNDFTGIEEYIEQARRLSGGDLPPEVAYVYGKWLFKRTDGSLDERVDRAQAAFRPLASQPDGPFRLLAMYFIGVGEVRRKNFPQAIAEFDKVVSEPARTPRDLKVQALANLSLGRLLYEQEKYDDALDRYGRVPRESESFVDSLYEIAWTQVKRGEFEKAKNATDILLLVGPDSTIAPEAQILQGHLQLKLRRYDEASETYNGVINTYAPVRDEIEALIAVNKDPVAYFDDLLARNSRQLDVTALLPPAAVKWATTQREVADAVKMVSDLESGRRGVEESDQISQRIMHALDERGMESFPALQEGYVRADAVDSALTQANQRLVKIEADVVDSVLTAQDRAALGQLRNEQAELRTRFESMPKTEKEIIERKDRIRQRVSGLDRSAFKLGYEVQSMLAMVAAVEKWLADTKSQRKDSDADEKAFTEKVRHEIESLAALTKELESVRRDLSEQRSNAETAIAGEEVIRRSYDTALAKEHEILATTEQRLTPERRSVLDRTARVRADLEQVRVRVIASKDRLRQRVAAVAKETRDAVLAEQARLAKYSTEVAGVSGNARNLVGRIAFDSFKRVRSQFYELVLKADVGVVDVAFTRKQDKTGQIQKLASQKDRELKGLDQEFKEVLKDVD